MFSFLCGWAFVPWSSSFIYPGTVFFWHSFTFVDGISIVFHALILLASWSAGSNSPCSRWFSCAWRGQHINLSQSWQYYDFCVYVYIYENIPSNFPLYSLFDGGGFIFIRYHSQMISWFADAPAKWGSMKTHCCFPKKLYFDVGAQFLSSHQQYVDASFGDNIPVYSLHN